jgi:hypothetical protein
VEVALLWGIPKTVPLTEYVATAGTTGATGEVTAPAGVGALAGTRSTINEIITPATVTRVVTDEGGAVMGPRGWFSPLV